MAERRSLLLRDGEGGDHRVEFDGDSVVVDGATVAVQPSVQGAVRVGGPRTRMAWTAGSAGTQWVFLDGEVFTFASDSRGAVRKRQGAHGSLAAPMPATVRQIAVEVGAVVRQGDVLVVLEAMKMELPVRAPADGTVTAVKCRVGEMVQAGHELIELTP
jgi:3-methylcrotonyl-CoA carboxylase alpha subunit